MFLDYPGGRFRHRTAAFVPEEFKLDQAQELLNICTVSPSHPDYMEAYGFCVGYFTGAMHYHRALAKGPDHKAIVCPEHTVTRAEAISVFVAWARDNPIPDRGEVACKPGEQGRSELNPRGTTGDDVMKR
jgi:hypothetical protein